MALDIQPLSAARRAVTLLVLLLLFLGSLGLAQMLVISHKAPLRVLALSLQHPPGFEDDPSDSQLNMEASVALKGTVGGSSRHLYLFQKKEAPASGDPKDVEQLLSRDATKFIAKYFGVQPTVAAVETLLNMPALEFEAPWGHGFVLMRTIYLEGEVISLVYVGATPPQDEDQAIWNFAVAKGLEMQGPQLKPDDGRPQ